MANGNSRGLTTRILLRGLLTASLLGITSACGSAAPGDLEAGEHVATTTSALAANAWREWGSGGITPFNLMPEPPALNANITLLSQIGVRGSGGNADKRYYFRTQEVYFSSSWQAFDGGTPQQPQNVRFNSPPACVLLASFPYSGALSSNQMVVAGKDTSNNMRVILATGGGSPTVDPTHPPAAPMPKTGNTWSSWSTLDSNYAYSGDDGYPALATSGSRVTLTFRAHAKVGTVTKNRIYAYSRAVPFSGSWSARSSAPDFPAGVLPLGTPSITYMADADHNQFDNKFLVMVRIDGNALAWITLRWDGSGNATWGTWTTASVPYGGYMLEDPVVEWDRTGYTNQNGTRSEFMTLYYLASDYSDNKAKVLQHSVPDPSQIGNYPFSYIDAADISLSTFRGAPRVTQGGGMESATRMLMINGYQESTPVASRNRSLLATQANIASFDWPSSPFDP